MIKKIGIFLGAIFIALVGIFSVNPLKNTAEPQYFNKTIQNAVVETATNEYTFYLDSNIGYFSELALTTIGKFEINSSIEVYTLNNEILNLPINAPLSLNFTSETTVDNVNCTNSFIIQTQLILFIQLEYSDPEIPNSKDNGWYYLDQTEEIPIFYEIKGFKLNGFEIETTFNVNEFLIPYIGNLTDFPHDTPQEETALDKIGSIVNSIITWFVNIFTGLSDTFYNTTTNQLTVWGSVLFIGIAILLVSICLKWLISLIKGI